jgi:transposase
MRIIKGINRHQVQFSSLDELIAPDNPVRILDAFAERLDMRGVDIKPRKTAKRAVKTNAGGAPRFADKLLLKLYLYGYLNKIRSSRKLEQECSRNMELRWLMQELVPNYHTIATSERITVMH